MIVRTERKSKFTVINNDLIDDNSLDWKDLGLLVYLLSKPDNWKVSVEHLARQKKLGRDGIYNCLNAVIKAGYAKRVKKSDGSIEWYIFDEKIFINQEEIPNPGNPEKAPESLLRLFPITENPDTENPTLINTNNKQRLNKEIKTKGKFVKPTVEEVRAYCQERGNDVDAEDFINHYEANGWKRGKCAISIVDWMACVRTWEKKNNFGKVKKQGDDKSVNPYLKMNSSFNRVE